MKDLLKSITAEDKRSPSTSNIKNETQSTMNSKSITLEGAVRDKNLRKFKNGEQLVRSKEVVEGKGQNKTIMPYFKDR